MATRKPKVSYSCAPCKRLKIKCDHNVPCSSCVHNSRQDECLQSPAKSLTQFKELIKPNASFGRISKAPSPDKQNLLLESGRRESHTSAISHADPFHSSDDRYSFSSASSNRDSVIMMDSMIKDQYNRIDELMKHNSLLSNQNADLVRQVGYYFQLSQRPGIEDFGANNLDNDKLFHMKKMMVSLLPARSVASILKKHFFVCVSYLCDVIDASEFDKDYERMLSHIANDRITNVDLQFLALALIVLCLGLRAAPRELLLSHEVMLRSWGNPEAVETTCSIWFRAARQIMAFYRQNTILTIQTFIIQSVYCSLANDMDSLDEILPLAIADAKKIKLNDPQSINEEGQSAIWWLLCYIDTQRALDTHGTPYIMCHKSKVELPRNPFIKYKAQITKILNSLYLYDFTSMSMSNKLQIISKLDDQICSIESQLVKPTTKLELFQHTALTTEICIHRQRLYESFISHDVPISSSICKELRISSFKAYKQLKSIYIVSQDPLYIVLSPILVQNAIVSSVFLINQSRLDASDVELIKGDIKTLEGDLMAMECFSPLPLVSHGIEGLHFLNSLGVSKRRASCDSIKMRLDSIINVPEDVSLMDRSVRILEELERNGGPNFERSQEGEEIKRRFGEFYEDYCAFVE